MSTRCPFCGSVKTEKTFNFNESTCLICECDFKVLDGGRIRVFNNGSWSTFCENMAKEASNLFSKADVIELTTRLFKEHARHIDEADILLDQVTQMAENLSYEVKAGVRDRNDFIKMVSLAESVETAVKTLIEAGEFVPLRGFDIQDFQGEVDDIDMDDVDSSNNKDDDVKKWVSGYLSQAQKWREPRPPVTPVENPNFIKDVKNDDVPEAMGFDEELEEDDLDDPISDVEDELSDVDDATFGIETKDDVRDVRDELRDVKDAINDLWDAYKTSEEGEMGGDDMGMDLGSEDDMGLDLGSDEGSEDDMDLDLGSDEDTGEGEEDSLDLEGGDEAPEGEGMAVGIEDKGPSEEESNPFESMRRKGKNISESTIGSPSKKNNNKLRNGYKTQKSNSVNVTHDEAEWDGEEEADIPFTKEANTDGKNQFGETKLSNGPGAVLTTPKGEDFVLKGKPNGYGLGIKREGFNGYRVGDAIFINESRDEWVIKSIKRNKAIVNRGRTSIEVDLLDEGVEQADRNLRHHRHQDLIKESQLAWQRCENKILEEGCVGGVCGLGSANSGKSGGIGSTMVSDLSPVTIGGNNVIGGQGKKSVVDKTEIYKYIKDNDLHRSTRDRAFEDLQYTFNNPLEELNIILDDAILSNDEAQTESIDTIYHYNRVVERNYQEQRRLNDAFSLIESRNENERIKVLKEFITKNPVPIITRREEQGNDNSIECLGRTWLNRISEGLEEV